MEKKFIVKLTVTLTVLIRENETIDKVLEDMDYNFSTGEGSKSIIRDTEIADWTIIESNY